MTTPDRYAELGDEDWWYDMRVAYNYGLIEPEPGTAEAEAFRQMDEYARSEVVRADERDAEYARQKAAREAEPDTGQPAPSREPEADWKPNHDPTRQHGSLAMSTHHPRHHRDPEPPDPDVETPTQPAPDLSAERLAYSVDEAARLTGLSRDLLYDQMRRGNLSYLKVGRRRLITRQHLQQFLGATS